MKTILTDTDVTDDNALASDRIVIGAHLIHIIDHLLIEVEAVAGALVVRWKAVDFILRTGIHSDGGSSSRWRESEMWSGGEHKQTDDRMWS